MSDLAEKIQAAIQAEEDSVPPLHIEGRYVGPRTDAERAVLRRCAAAREIVGHYENLVNKYRRLKAQSDRDIGEDYDLGATEVLIAEYAAIILPTLARGYGVQPSPGDDHA